MGSGSQAREKGGEEVTAATDGYGTKADGTSGWLFTGLPVDEYDKQCDFSPASRSRSRKKKKKKS